MLVMKIGSLKFDKDLQIVQADVRMEVEGESIADETMCVDVGLPALLASCFEPTRPDRWAPADEWRKVPFFVCGCGDPECRGVGFVTTPQADGTLELIEVEQGEDRMYREHGTYRVPLEDYRRHVLAFAERFLAFVEPLDYQPYMKDTVPVVRDLTEKLRTLLESGK